VPCDGKEHFREAQRKWAEAFVGKLVAVQNYDLYHKKFVWIPGLATGVSNAPGGWPHVTVHVAVSEIPSHQYWLPQPLRGLSGFYGDQYDEIDGRAFWYDSVSDPKLISVINEPHPELLEIQAAASRLISD
jgi:hypothetical protein